MKVTNTETEKQIEAYLRNRVQAVGGIAFKFVSPGNDGVPDRMVCLPGGRVLFVELKGPTGKLSVLQERQISRLGNLGHTVYIMNSKEAVDQFCERVIGQ